MFSLVALTYVFTSTRKSSARFPVKSPEHGAKDLTCMINAQVELSDFPLCFSFMYECGVLARWRRHLLVAKTSTASE